MNIIFDIICYFHIIIWLIVCFSFINKKAAYINIYYIIPIIYLSHILPFHTLTKLKEILEPDNTDNKIKNFENKNNLILFYNKIKDIFNNSFASPISPQGLLIFGLITSIYSLRDNLVIK